MRRICVVTGTRAEYGLLYWLMKEIQADRELQLQVMVTGMHLSPEFGLTYKIIEEDGFIIDAKVEMLLSSDTPIGIAKSIGLGVIGFADALERLKPDIMVVLGDRYEILAAVQAAMVARIPIAHIHGGELTEGAIDEGIRHAVTKLAHFHFAAAEPYRRRIIQLGEQPNTVFTVGAPGLDNIKNLQLLDREDFEKATGFKLGKLNFMVTYHPETLGNTSSSETMFNLLNALDHFCDAHIIFTRPNSDADSRVINRMLDKYVERAKERTAVFTSLGQLNYLSALKHVDVVIGNSSSGIIEAPACHVATVNIGDRQKGRLKSDSVIDCDASVQSVVAAINKALSTEFRKITNESLPPYGDGNASQHIKHHLKSAVLTTRKIFFDI